MREHHAHLPAACPIRGRIGPDYRFARCLPAVLMDMPDEGKMRRRCRPAGSGAAGRHIDLQVQRGCRAPSSTRASSLSASPRRDTAAELARSGQRTPPPPAPSVKTVSRHRWQLELASGDGTKKRLQRLERGGALHERAAGRQRQEHVASAAAALQSTARPLWNNHSTSASPAR